MAIQRTLKTAAPRSILAALSNPPEGALSERSAAESDPDRSGWWRNDQVACGLLDQRSLVDGSVRNSQQAATR
jgi:hypothetical protein